METLHPPGPAPFLNLGITPRLILNPLKCFQELHIKYGDIVRFQKGSSFRYIVFHPDEIQQVLVNHSRRYKKSARYEKLKDFLGDGLVTSEGETWQKPRRLVQNFFQPRKLPDYQTFIRTELEAMGSRWRRQRSIAIDDEMIKVTMGIIGRSLMGADLSAESSQLGQCVKTCVNYMNFRMETLWEPPHALSLRRKFFFKALRRLDCEVLNLIRAREKMSGVVPKDLLTELLNSRGIEGGDIFTEKMIRDQLMTFLVAGHETSANMLSWTFRLLMDQPKVLSNLLSEITSIDGDSLSDLLKLPFLDAVLQESLRLFPPVWMISRDSVETDTWRDYKIPTGSTVNICPYVTQRSEKFFDRPEIFEPERFIHSRDKTLRHLPFSAGPRSCVGAGFALMEAKLILSYILRNFRLTVSGPIDLKPQVSVVLRPKKRLLIEVSSLN